MKKSKKKEASIQLRMAKRSDWERLAQLLTEAKLPLGGARDIIPDFLIAERDKTLVGSSALEYYGRYALLRSVAVRESERKAGVGKILVETTLALAKEKKIKSIFLLTESAREYFPKFGFQEISRERVPDDVLQSIEFQELCPDSATVMRLDLK